MEIIINEKDLVIVKNKEQYYVIYEKGHQTMEQRFLDKYNGKFTETISLLNLSKETIEKLHQLERK